MVATDLKIHTTTHVTSVLQGSRWLLLQALTGGVSKAVLPTCQFSQGLLFWLFKVIAESVQELVMGIEAVTVLTSISLN